MIENLKFLLQIWFLRQFFSILISDIVKTINQPQTPMDKLPFSKKKLIT